MVAASVPIWSSGVWEWSPINWTVLGVCAGVAALAGRSSNDARRELISHRPPPPECWHPRIHCIRPRNIAHDRNLGAAMHQYRRICWIGAVEGEPDMPAPTISSCSGREQRTASPPNPARESLLRNLFGDWPAERLSQSTPGQCRWRPVRSRSHALSVARGPRGFPRANCAPWPRCATPGWSAQDRGRSGGSGSFASRTTSCYLASIGGLESCRYVREREQVRIRFRPGGRVLCTRKCSCCPDRRTHLPPRRSSSCRTSWTTG